MPGKCRQNEADGHLLPRHRDDYEGPEIGEQRERQPFENRGITAVRQRAFERRAEDAEAEDIDELRSAAKQRRRVAHRAEVRSDVDSVGDEQQPTIGCSSQPG